MKVREIMTQDPACCTPETSVQDVARMMVDCDCGQIPVVDDLKTRRPLGVVTDRDIVCRSVARGTAPSALMARDVMSTPAITVTPESPIEECCRLLEEKRVRRAPVIDDHGRCCGIVALADIAHHAPDRITVEVIRTVSQRPTGTRSTASNPGGAIRA